MDVRDEKEEAAKEAPCYGSQILEDHTFSGGKCVYCGRPQPGGYVEKKMAPMFKDDEAEHPEFGKPCEECGGWQYNHRSGCAAVE